MESRLLDDLERLLCLALRRDAAEAGVSEATARVLLALEPGVEVPMRDVAMRVGRSPSTATRFVDRAVVDGLVARRAGADRRRRLASLTAAGEETRGRLLAQQSRRATALPRTVAERSGIAVDRVSRVTAALVYALTTHLGESAS